MYLWSRGKMRRRLLIILAILLLCLSFVGATTAMAGDSNKNPDAIGQTLGGYIEEVFLIDISSPIYTGEGFNLNVTDESNPYRFQLAPTSTALEAPGLMIGTFSIITSKTDIAIKITHTPLILHYDDGSSASATEWVDWELGVSWLVDGQPQVGMCLSSNWNAESSVPENLRKIIIPMNEGDVYLQNSGLYFRLTSSSPVTKEGRYLSSVIFEVEDL